MLADVNVGARFTITILPTGILLEDMRLRITGGLKPGDLAPDLELESTDGERIRLSSLRGKPVVLMFGSIT